MTYSNYVVTFDTSLERYINSPVEVNILTFNDDKDAFLRIDKWCYPLYSWHINDVSRELKKLDSFKLRGIRTNAFSIGESCYWRWIHSATGRFNIKFIDFEVDDNFISFILESVKITSVYSVLSSKEVVFRKESGLLTIFDDMHVDKFGRLERLEHERQVVVNPIPLEDIAKLSVFGFK